MRIFAIKFFALFCVCARSQLCDKFGVWLQSLLAFGVYCCKYRLVSCCCLISATWQHATTACSTAKAVAASMRVSTIMQLNEFLRQPQQGNSSRIVFFSFADVILSSCSCYCKIFRFSSTFGIWLTQKIPFANIFAINYFIQLRNASNGLISNEWNANNNVRS